ncbi:MAG: hypothetical protein ABXS91_02980 [Sulfurimonas sp.]
MQYFFIFLLILFFSSVTLDAEEVKPSSTDIQTLVSQIKKAPASKKRVLMNQLKIKLRKMNEKSRKEVMANLKSSFAQKDQAMQTSQGTQDSTKIQSRQIMRHTAPRPMPQAGGRR